MPVPFRRNAYRRPVQPVEAIAPLPGCVVNAVLRFHDESQDQGCGRSLLRLSARRLRDSEVRAALGEFTTRAAGVSILWNDREDQIIRVLEAPIQQLAA